MIVSPAEATSTNGAPLVVDIGDLMATQWCDEYLLNRWRRMPAQSWISKTRRDHELATADVTIATEIENWPVRETLVAELEAAAQSGRSIVLVTSAPHTIAAAVAARFPFVSRMVANAPRGGLERNNFIGGHFPNGFAIFSGTAGDERSNLGLGTLTVFRKTLRLHQWAKNLLVFVPLVLGGKLSDGAAWLTAGTGFVALGMIASATYIINDLIDLPSDRSHRTKRWRPLASGAVPIRTVAVLALALLAGGFALIFQTTTAAILIVTVYLLMTLAYSGYLKRVPIIDVFTLACLFTIRLGIGIALADVQLSPWLLVFSMFIFLSLSVAKRHTEILGMIALNRSALPGRGYRVEDAPLTLGLGLASGMAAVLIMVVYLVEDAVPRDIYREALFLWAIPPILFLFIGRIWLLTQRGTMNEDPVAFALKDRVSLAYGAGMLAALALALIGVGR